jgi:MtaA/CmuA family methyltransferase
MTGVTADLMGLCGSSWPEAHKNAGDMVNLAAAAHNFCGLESMKLPFCMTVEAEALGCAISYGDEMNLPQVKSHPFSRYDRLSPPADYLRRARVPIVLEAIRMAKDKYAGFIPVVSSVVGPFTLACKVFDFQDVLADILLDPGEIIRMLDVLTDLCKSYMKAQQDAGSDVILIGEASCSGDVVSPEIYRDFILPCHQKIGAAISVPTVVHICGNCTGHLPYIARSNISGFSFDVKTDIAECVRQLKGNTAIIGYVDPLAVLLNGTPETVESETRICRQNGVDVLNAGCAWPPGVPLDNVRTFVKAGIEI